MLNKKISDVVLVYDRYYASKPNPVLLAVKRIFLCCAVTVCAMMFVLGQYRLPVSGLLCTCVSALFAAEFSLLFIFVKKRFMIPAVMLIIGTVIWLRWESFSEKITYFTDSIWMSMDGRFVNGLVMIDHDHRLLTDVNPDYVSGVTLGVVLLIMLFAMVTAAGMFIKPHTLPSFLTWIVLWVPVFISEKFTFNWWIVPAVALYMGSFAASLAYFQGLTLKSGKGGSYSNAAALNERSFMNSLAKSPYIKRVEMKSAYYSKYFSLTMYAAAVFAAIGVVTSVVFRDSSGMDYSRLYEFVANLGRIHSSNKNNNPSSEDGPISDYFAEPLDNSSHLSITSPGRSNLEILSVINPGNTYVYLRGDYGVELKGDFWESPVNREPSMWRTGGNFLKDDYRPAEMSILKTVLQRGDYNDDTVESTDIIVSYLRDSNVVFLPAYTSVYPFYDNDMFNIYGDFVTRVDDAYKKIDRVECTALIPKFSNQDGSMTQSDLDYLRKAISAADEWDFNGVMNSFLSERDLVDAYRKYVYGTFLDISNEKKNFMLEFLQQTEIMDTLRALKIDGSISDRERNFRMANVVCTYLVNNYTYSLDAEIIGMDPVEGFLTVTKSGHCALYASSMTLMMRALNIPARYCTGFVAPPNGKTPTILRSKNLHAWCEVYLDELGWVTFDPTSSSLFSQNNNPDRDTNSSSSQREESSSNESSDSLSDDSDSSRDPSDSDDSSSESSGSDSSGSTDEGDSSFVGSDKQRINILPYLLIILAVLAAAALVILIIRSYNLLGQKARKAIRRYCRERKAGVLLDKIIALLELAGLTPQNGELPEQFYNRAEKVLRCSFAANKEQLEAAAFGKNNISDTDCDSLARLLEQLYTALDSKLGFFEKIRLRTTVIK